MPNDCWLADSKTAHLGLSQSEDDTARWDQSNSVSATRGKNGGTASYIEIILNASSGGTLSNYALVKSEGASLPETATIHGDDYG